MKNFVFVIVFLMLLPKAHSQVFVGNGNGGTGVESGGRLYLKDLFENGNHLHPYIGPSLDNGVVEMRSHLNQLLPIDINMNLFQRKLSDLERSRKGLGLLIIHVLERYNFKFSYDNLSAGIPRLRIANRTMTTIFFDYANWSRLDPENRVAVLIHEGLTSLSKNSCFPEEGCEDENRKDQKLVSLLFEEKADRQQIEQLVMDRLSLQDVTKCVWSDFQIKVSLLKKHSSAAGEIKIAYLRGETASGNDLTATLDAVSDLFCKGNFQSDGSEVISVEATVERFSFHSRRVLQGGVEPTSWSTAQIAFVLATVQARSKMVSSNVQIITKDNCYGFIRNNAGQNIFSGDRSFRTSFIS